jgi:hypothetical protein
MVLAIAPTSPPATGQLELRGTSNRPLALLRERQKLVANVTRKKDKLDKLLALLDAQQPAPQGQAQDFLATFGS